jgi:hypothetical protein
MQVGSQPRNRCTRFIANIVRQHYLPSLLTGLGLKVSQLFTPISQFIGQTFKPVRPSEILAFLKRQTSREGFLRIVFG